jgi:hypothetical protein
MLGLLITMEGIQRFGAESITSENGLEKVKVHGQIQLSQIVAA